MLNNINQITTTLRGMSDQQLQQYAAMHKTDPFVFPLAFQESQARQQLRAGSLAQRMGQKPPPVVDQDLAQMAPTPITGGAGQTITGGHGQAINVLPEQQGIGALPAQNLEGMADGGIAGYATVGNDGNAAPNPASGPAGQLAFNNEPVMRMAGGGIAHFASKGAVKSDFTREQMLQIVKDTNAQLPKPIEEMTDAEMNAWMSQNKPLVESATVGKRERYKEPDLSPAANALASGIYTLGKGTVGAGNLAKEMVEQRTKELGGVSTGQSKIADYFTMPQSQYNLKYPDITPTSTATNTPASTQTVLPPSDDKSGLGPDYEKYEDAQSKTPFKFPTITAPTLTASGVPVGPVPTAARAKEQANVFYNPNDIKSMLEENVTETGVQNAQNAEALRKLMESRPTLGKKQEARLAAEEAKEPELKQQNKDMALLQAGLAVLGGTSPYAFQNLSKAAVGVEAYKEGLKDLKKAHDLRQQALDHIDDMRDAQAIGDQNLAYTEQQKAGDKMLAARSAATSGFASALGVSGQIGSHIFDNANSNYFSNLRTNAEIGSRTALGNAQLQMDAARLNMLPESIRTAQILGEGNIQTGYNMGVAKQHATELYTKWGQLAYPNGNMGQPNEAFLKMYPSANAYVQEGLEAAGFGKTSNSGFTTDLPKGANVLQPSKK
jgi:hypothetical protein